MTTEIEVYSSLMGDYFDFVQLVGTETLYCNMVRPVLCYVMVEDHKSDHRKARLSNVHIANTILLRDFELMRSTLQASLEVILKS